MRCADGDEVTRDRPAAATCRDDVELAMVAYMEREAATRGTPWPSIARHMMGLWNGRPGARRWRQVWSDHRLKAESVRGVWHCARDAISDVAA